MNYKICFANINIDDIKTEIKQILLLLLTVNKYYYKIIYFIVFFFMYFKVVKNIFTSLLQYNLHTIFFLEKQKKLYICKIMSLHR
jgi:hypothetical protein